MLHLLTSLFKIFACFIHLYERITLKIVDKISGNSLFLGQDIINWIFTQF